MHSTQYTVHSTCRTIIFRLDVDVDNYVDVDYAGIPDLLNLDDAHPVLGEIPGGVQPST